MTVQMYKYGEIVTFTTVNKGAGQLAEPYILAVIRLDEGCHVLARIECGNAESVSTPSIGHKVRYLHDDEYGKIFSMIQE